MAKNLVIVESPAKAKTIEKYLGKDFKVLSSIGHIRSIAKKTKDGTPPIDVGNGFATVYEIDPEKRKTITENGQEREVTFFPLVPVFSENQVYNPFNEK